MKFHIFDTNIFLKGLEFNLIPGIIYTTPRIIQEIKVNKYKDKNRNILNRIEVALANKKLIVKSPLEKFFKIVEKKAKKTGDFNALSEADKQLIALAVELNDTESQDVILFSDDYSIENVCSELNISYSPLYKEGIETKIMWEVFCSFCQKTFKADDLQKRCEICGSKLKRRPKSKEL
ncbi:MAG: NOB1 family endonuclease [Promethearchaeota archaeon]|jgi:rRNA maturation endonuclease Nob1